MPYYYIQVRGEIKTEDETPQYALGWTCGSIGGEVTNPRFAWNNKDNLVESDLILNKRIRSVPYALYYTEKGICGEHITCCPGHSGAYLYYRENMAKIEKQLCALIDHSIAALYYNGLYLSAFSALELFLCDCYIFSDERCYTKALEFYAPDKSPDSDNNTLINKTRNFFFNYVYHRFKDVQKMYKAILGDCFPEHQYLDSLLHKRNNLVHRFGMDSFSRMQNTDATKKDVEIAVKAISSFAESLNDNIWELKK